MSEDERDGFSEAATRSEGDPKVVFALNAVLSAAFAAFVIWGLSILGVVEYSAVNVATLAIVLFSVTYLMTA
jgi:hypothetical protein